MSCRHTPVCSGLMKVSFDCATAITFAVLTDEEDFRDGATVKNRKVILDIITVCGKWTSILTSTQTSTLISLHDFLPRGVCLELGRLVSAGTTGRVLFRDEAGVERTEPEGGEHQAEFVFYIFTSFPGNNSRILMKINQASLWKRYLWVCEGNSCSTEF